MVPVSLWTVPGTGTVPEGLRGIGASESGVEGRKRSRCSVLAVFPLQIRRGGFRDIESSSGRLRNVTECDEASEHDENIGTWGLESMASRGQVPVTSGKSRRFQW